MQMSIAPGAHHLGRPGGRIAFTDTVSGPLIVAVPGMGDLRSVYDGLVTDLVGRDFRVVVTDVRGHGDSDMGFAEQGDAATASDLVALLESLGEPALLIGNSFSGSAAVLAAADRPDLVAGLVPLSPFLREPASAGRLRMNRLLFRLLFPAPGAASGSYDAGTRTAAPSRPASAHVAEIAAALREPGRPAAFRRLTLQLDHSVVEPRVSAVRAPALIAVDALDPDYADPAAELRGGRSARDPPRPVPRTTPTPSVHLVPRHRRLRRRSAGVSCSTPEAASAATRSSTSRPPRDGAHLARQSLAPSPPQRRRRAEPLQHVAPSPICARRRPVALRELPSQRRRTVAPARAPSARSPRCPRFARGIRPLRRHAVRPAETTARRALPPDPVGSRSAPSRRRCPPLLSHRHHPGVRSAVLGFAVLESGCASAATPHRLHALLTCSWPGPRHLPLNCSCPTHRPPTRAAYLLHPSRVLRSLPFTPRSPGPASARRRSRPEQIHRCDELLRTVSSTPRTPASPSVARPHLTGGPRTARAPRRARSPHPSRCASRSPLDLDVAIDGVHDLGQCTGPRHRGGEGPPPMGRDEHRRRARVDRSPGVVPAHHPLHDDGQTGPFPQPLDRPEPESRAIQPPSPRASSLRSASRFISRSAPRSRPTPSAPRVVRLGCRMRSPVMSTVRIIALAPSSTARSTSCSEIARSCKM